MSKSSIIGFLALFTLLPSKAQETDHPAAIPAKPSPSIVAQATQPSPLTRCLKTEQDSVGKALQGAFVWATLQLDMPGVVLGFRKTFELWEKPSSALLHLFADARYILWVNGTYVDRGPARFQPNGPEYDTIDIARFLKPGRNAIALLVVGNLSGGKVMRHRPGVSASLQVDGRQLWTTDKTWKWTDRTRFRLIKANWPNLWDAEVDARVEEGDWTAVDFDDSAWQAAVPVSGSDWGPLTARRIPMLRETQVPVHLADGKAFPVTLKTGEKLKFTTDRIVQVYPLIEFTSSEGTELLLQPFGLRYTAKYGAQSHFTIDTKGIANGEIIIVKGEATVMGLKLIERLYPFDRLASFECNDPYLNRLWKMCARSCELLSEDSYVDCADRERVEWMDNTPPGYDITRTAMSGPAGPDGKKAYGDPRLLGELLRRTALTLQPEGWVKAHTCSDRYDVHAKMEDRACDWVEGIRLYYEATGDAALVREVWPAVAIQMDYFLKRRTDKGLVSGRDWVVWGNPLGYSVGQTTTLNAFVYKGLVDAAYLAGVIGNTAEQARFLKAAVELASAINTTLWDDAEGCYFSGYFSDAELAESGNARHAVRLKVTDGLTAPTLHGNLFALDRGVVPLERRRKVIECMLKTAPDPKHAKGAIMVYYYLFKQLYALDDPGWDDRILEYFRTAWEPMLSSPWQCSWESFGGGSKAHIYGMYPGYFLSAYVLGVRRDAPVADKQLLIEPHLGSLHRAQGTVVTEFGPVAVAWTEDAGKLRAELTLPEGPSVTLSLPRKDGVTGILVNGKEVHVEERGRRFYIPLGSGKHTILY